MLAGRARAGYLEACWRRPEGGMGQSFRPGGDRRSLAELVVSLALTTDVYVGVEVRTHRHGGADVVPTLNVLRAACDAPEAIDAITRFNPRPTAVINSGRGRHAYWQLAAPLGAEHARRANRRLAHALGADLRATDPARILRPPLSTSHKFQPPVASDVAIRTTYNRYGHLMPGGEAEAAAKLEAFVVGGGLAVGE